GPDLAQARRLVQASGTVGMRVTVSTPRPPLGAARVIAATLRQLGYRVHLSILSQKAYQAAWQVHPPVHLQGGHYYRWRPDYVVGGGLLDPAFRCLPDRDDVYGFHDAVACAYVRRAQALFRQGREREANAVWSQADHALVDRAFFVAYGNPDRTEVTSRRVGNYHYDPLYGLELGQAWVR